MWNMIKHKQEKDYQKPFFLLLKKNQIRAIVTTVFKFCFGLQKTSPSLIPY